MTVPIASIASIACIIATRDRPDALATMLATLAAQTRVPETVVLVDASSGMESQQLFERGADRFADPRYQRASLAGAAAQRNEGVASVRAFATTILFLDDDVRLAPDCVERLWAALDGDPGLGGVNAMITNQRYTSPGLVSRTLFRVLHGRRETTYAGLCVGPAMNLLPEDRADLPDVVPVQWLNTTCTLYRTAALPAPPFPDRFTGYSLFEDVALSLTVGRTWRLANTRTARIVHESRGGAHKSDPRAMARMELVNRHFVMTRILGRRSLADYARLLLVEAFGLANELRSATGVTRLPHVVAGKCQGVIDLLTGS
jgi:GT2 family glycosyltransferase